MQRVSTCLPSLAGLRGSRCAPAHAASKASVSNYLQGLRYRFSRLKLSIAVTDVQPGFIDTRMAKADRLIWVASPKKAARQITGAIRRRQQRVYITRGWRLFAMLLKVLPDALPPQRKTSASCRNFGAGLTISPTIVSRSTPLPILGWPPSFARGK